MKRILTHTSHDDTDIQSFIISHISAPLFPEVKKDRMNHKRGNTL